MATPKRAPSDARRSAIRVQLTILPSELVELDALAHRLAPPGYAPNRSDAVRRAVQAVLNAEASGLMTIDDGRIFLDRRTRQ